MKRAFSLIEVMVSIMIFFVVTMAILEIVKNYKHLIFLAKEKKEFNLKASVAFLHKGDDNYKRTLEFNITNDEIIKTLKKDKIKVKVIEHNSTIKELKAYDKNHSLIIYSIGLK